jgi:hypothetical protein
MPERCGKLRATGGRLLCRIRAGSGAGLPDFSLYKIPIRGEKYTKGPQNYQMSKNMPNGCKIFKMDTKYVFLKFPFQGPKNIKIEIFGMKIYHLATLIWSQSYGCDSQRLREPTTQRTAPVRL